MLTILPDTTDKDVFLPRRDEIQKKKITADYFIFFQPMIFPEERKRGYNRENGRWSLFLNFTLSLIDYHMCFFYKKEPNLHYFIENINICS